MRRRLVVKLTLTTMLITVVFVSGVNAAPRAGAATTGRYIVVLKDSVNTPAAVAAEHARTQSARIRHVYRSALKGYSARYDLKLWIGPLHEGATYPPA